MNTNENKIQLPSAVTAQYANPDTTSDKYTFIPTTRVIGVLESQGWRPVKGLAVKPRTKDPRFVRHAVEFEHDRLSALSDNERFRITVVNSHDGSSSFRFYSGLMRIICANGLVAGKSLETFRVRHVGFTDALVKEALEYTVNQAPKISRCVLAMKNTPLDAEQTVAFYSAVVDALELRLWEPQQMHIARRVEDRRNDLWTVFNRVQEHVIRGGLQGVSKDKHGNLVPRSMRAIKSIQRQLEVNRTLWDTAETFIDAA